MPRAHLLRLGQTVRQARRTAGLTQEQLGSPLLTKSFVSQLEQGMVSPSLTSLFHISDKIGLRPARLLGVADETQLATTALDMAEAALLLDGIGAGNAWVQQLEQAVMPTDKLAEHGLAHRWQRYAGLQRLLQGRTAAAIALFEAALKSCPDAEVGRGRIHPFADDHVTKFWLGTAHRQAAHLLQALRVWENLVTLEITPLLATATWRHLHAVYDAIGDGRECRRAREQLHGSDDMVACLDVGTPLARMLWQWAREGWDAGDVNAASAYARIVPLLLSEYALSGAHDGEADALA